MRVRDWFRPPRQLMLVFLVVALASTTALGWLTRELLAQDREAEAQRRLDDVERAADQAVAAAGEWLAAIEPALGSGNGAAGPLPAGGAVVSYQDGHFHAAPPGAVRYYPVPAPASPEAGRATLDAAERLEFAPSAPAGLDAAARAYRRLAASQDPALRAAALTRLARVERKEKAWPAALAVYDELQTLDAVATGGLPAPLIARAGRAEVFEARNDTAHLHTEAQALRNDLESGVLQLTAAQYDYWAGQVGRWLGSPVTLSRSDRLRADALEWFWEQRAKVPPHGPRLVTLGTGTALLVWQSSPAGARWAVAVLDAPAVGAIAAGDLPEDVAWALTDAEGRRFAGSTPANPETVRSAAATGLPWTLHVFPSPDAPAPVSPRRTLLQFVVVSVAGLLVAGWYFIWRGISREVRVARLQSDFVAAVSHEFRSPLTSLRHIAELLASDRMPSEERRRRSYAVLVNETDRLGRLVENLLEFGRLEAGKATFRKEPVGVADLVGAVVHEFARQADAAGHVVELASEGVDAVVLADREAIGRAVWNLLDNAVKYSPGGSRVRVRVAPDRDGRMVSVAVTDEGPGIARADQKRIFERFARGGEATDRRIHGTGIGLAMVREIARAHGGDVAVASEPGHGSTFTIELPVIPQGD